MPGAAAAPGEASSAGGPGAEAGARSGPQAGEPLAQRSLRAAGALAAGLAHDLNNALTTAGGHAEMLLLRGAIAPDRRDELDEVKRAVDRACELTQRLAALAGSHRGAAAVPCDASRIAANVAQALPHVLGPGVPVELRLARESCQVAAPPPLLEQLVLSLCLHAQSGLHAAVPDAAADGGDPLCIDTRSEPGRVLIRVGREGAPRGSPLPPAFDGLGMPFAIQLARALGGELSSGRSPKGGESCTLAMPAAPPMENVAANAGAEASAAIRASRPAEPETLDASQSRGGETILVVDDNAPVRELMARILEDHGYRPLLAADADEALELVARPGGRPQLLLTDISLPGLDGRALRARLEALHPGLRAVFVTGHAVAPGDPAGSEPILPKPFRAEELAQAVRRALDAPSEPRGVVLVVDDEPDVLEVVREMLQSSGFAVLTARDGAEALELLEHQRCDAVLCDLLMPNKEGIETCTDLRRLHPGLPVVAMTGATGGRDYLDAARKLGAVGGLAKPFSRGELVAELRGAIEGGRSG